MNYNAGIVFLMFCTIIRVWPGCVSQWRWRRRVSSLSASPTTTLSIRSWRTSYYEQQQHTKQKGEINNIFKYLLQLTLIIREDVKIEKKSVNLFPPDLSSTLTSTIVYIYNKCAMCCWCTSSINSYFSIQVLG